MGVNILYLNKNRKIKKVEGVVNGTKFDFQFKEQNFIIAILKDGLRSNTESITELEQYACSVNGHEFGIENTDFQDYDRFLSIETALFFLIKPTPDDPVTPDLEAVLTAGNESVKSLILETNYGWTDIKVSNTPAFAAGGQWAYYSAVNLDIINNYNRVALDADERSLTFRRYGAADGARFDLTAPQGTNGNTHTITFPENDGEIMAKVNAPATATSTGQIGQYAYDSNYFYVCTAVNTWVRTALATW